jgi:hypothetical protein
MIIKISSGYASKNPYAVCLEAVFMVLWAALSQTEQFNEHIEIFSALITFLNQPDLVCVNR